ncbi:hypothetical protein BOTBODRAFT_352351 [Botryobasidium botryosum FD-172 SS1]|uniref:Mitochondrial glycine transporter n=1 Tax=Botryobasidium botryosum (strain FD-172 SS1) TaxID=930990 RepID=A0A067MQJ3_BOTB1|nr:hypothetical protein BOTBODRAFT_352351 [Botryobasidium botryosum FD-172 SS1]
MGTGYASHHLFSGGLSGLVSVLTLQPLDLLKTRVQQIQHATPGKGGIFAVTRHILATDGTLGLWRGTAPTLARNVPGVGLYFYTLQTVRYHLIPYFSPSKPTTSSSSSSVLPKLSANGNLISGALCRTAVGLLLNPFAVVKTRFESDTYAYRNMREAFRAIVATEGYRGFLQGFTASALRDAPHAGIFVLSYEAVKERTTTWLRPESPSATALILSFSGAAAGTIATIVTHPFDMIKTQMQIRTEPQYRSVVGTIVGIIRERGPSGFLDGVSLRLTRKVFSSAIAWTVYEAMMIALQKKEPE